MTARRLYSIDSTESSFFQNTRKLATQVSNHLLVIEIDKILIVLISNFIFLYQKIVSKNYYLINHFLPPLSNCDFIKFKLLISKGKTSFALL